MGYLRSFASLTESIIAKGGVPVIITAEDASQLDAVRNTTGYTREAMSDPDHLLATELKKRGLLNVAITEKSGYPHGVAQPAVLVMRSDGSVLQQWAIVPSMVRYHPSRLGSISWCWFANDTIFSWADELRRCKRQAANRPDLGECAETARGKEGGVQEIQYFRYSVTPNF
jgi:hypothetical protein